jgi:hypothetical protein
MPTDHVKRATTSIPGRTHSELTEIQSNMMANNIRVCCSAVVAIVFQVFVRRAFLAHCFQHIPLYQLLSRDFRELV